MFGFGMWFCESGFMPVRKLLTVAVKWGMLRCRRPSIGRSKQEVPTLDNYLICCMQGGWTDGDGDGERTSQWWVFNVKIKLVRHVEAVDATGKHGLAEADQLPVRYLEGLMSSEAFCFEVYCGPSISICNIPLGKWQQQVYVSNTMEVNLWR